MNGDSVLNAAPLTLNDDDPRVTAAVVAEKQLYDFHDISYVVRYDLLARHGIKVRITETGEGDPVIIVPGNTGDGFPFIPAASPTRPPHHHHQSPRPVLKNHFEEQHLTADAVGKLAAGAGVGSVVTTHNAIPETLIPQARAAIASHYDGPVAFAKDLDKF
jgi:hypothetical protein